MFSTKKFHNFSMIIVATLRFIFQLFTSKKNPTTSQKLSGKPFQNTALIPQYAWSMEALSPLKPINLSLSHSNTSILKG